MKTLIFSIVVIMVAIMILIVLGVLLWGVKDIFIYYKNKNTYKSQSSNKLRKQVYQQQSQQSSNASNYSLNVQKHWLKLWTYSDSIGSRTTPFFALLLTFYCSMN